MTEKVTGRLDAVVKCLLDTVPGLSADRAADLVTEVSGAGRTLAGLEWHLRDHPDALSSGSSDVPQAVLRLMTLLADAGYAGVVVPRCADCDMIDHSSRRSVDR